MKKPTKKQWFIAGIVGCLLIIGGLFMWNRTNEPKNLGQNFEYIGKKNTTCEWWELPMYLIGCAGPRYDYYFATDLDKAELSNLFKKATHKYDSGVSGADYDYLYLSFQLKNDPDKTFQVGYFNEENKLKFMSSYGSDLKASAKKHIINISDQDYQTAKSAY